MGGAVFVGIRFPSGKEVLTEQWTNPMSGWFCNKRFLEGDEAFLEELMAFEEGDEWPKNEGRDAVFPSEYGVVLIDFVNMKAFSRQDYARPPAKIMRVSEPYTFRQCITGASKMYDRS